ncbi:hypothetical protein [Streptomyces sp. NBC_00063]|nr:hypothetical protein [Streptomyces sp. NBC_00063]MCX5443439.1 hypothetical protein [Streptomyces sp. NBC_00063]
MLHRAAWCRSGSVAWKRQHSVPVWTSVQRNLIRPAMVVQSRGSAKNPVDGVLLHLPRLTVLVQHGVDEAFTGSPMLLHGSDFFHLEGVGGTSGLATVFRDTLYR